jgi:ABC-type transport system involved in cytochrome bd biosynthesis fused ATPase/permease subunit
MSCSLVELYWSAKNPAVIILVFLLIIIIIITIIGFITMSDTLTNLTELIYYAS